MYALGVILNECYTRRQPWRDSSHFFQIILKVGSASVHRTWHGALAGDRDGLMGGDGGSVCGCA